MKYGEIARIRRGETLKTVSPSRVSTDRRLEPRHPGPSMAEVIRMTALGVVAEYLPLPMHALNDRALDKLEKQLDREIEAILRRK